MSAFRRTPRTLAGGYHRSPVDVALGKDPSGRPTVLVQGGAFRTAPGLSFTDREQVEALVEALNDALAEWDEDGE